NYSWWTYRANARANNKGWRIDYIMVSSSMRENLQSANILSDVVHSDHCPIKISLKV
ncbi:MAG: endonuclease/exonuclease/phosphatase family protein, partial [Bacteroidota bacterium]|nr:endonuclease/exonuclease/phosphatase family protein [Bacteroidota bacterium]